MSSISTISSTSEPLVAHDIAALEKALDTARAGFSLRQVPMSATEHWSLVDGAIQHRSGGFFSISGVRREGEEQERVMLYQPQGALNGLLSTVIGGERHFLLQARAEPGNLGEAQFGPTVQSTPANYLRMHGGARTPYIETFLQHSPDVTLLRETAQLDLGERYLFKTKRLIALEATENQETLPCFIWANPSAVRQAVTRSTFLNTDLRSMLAFSSWSADEADGELTPLSAEVRRSLVPPPRGEVLAELETALCAVSPRRTGFVPLKNLSNWELDDWGLRERVPDQGFSVEFFEVAAAYREVGQWIQPLINSGGEGRVVLACREVEGMTEVFVQPLAEFGLASGCALAPSYLLYPGMVDSPPEWLVNARILSETLESDEGGRFYKDSSRYQIVGIDADAPQPPTALGFWLRISEVKHCLDVSNRCSIQLRCILSHLLAVA
jgi:oxidase EvaA